ncbi:MAG: cysteine hydrolase [Clostridia bacterium]|nr:cysteine hydrolase [Clostridia bacterium]
MKKLLVVIDMQNDFVFGALGSKEAQSILPAVKETIEEFKKAGQTVVFTRDTHENDYLSTQEGKYLPVPHCIRGEKGWEIVDGLRENERVFNKPTFGSLALAEYIKAENFDEVTLIGVCTDICVASNALLIKATCPELPLRLIKNCCAGVTPQTHEAAIATLASCQVQIL